MQAAAAAEASAPGEYAGIASREALRRRLGRARLAVMLDAQLPRGVRLLQAGCGAGLLVNFLAMAPWRRVVGGDAAAAPLTHAEAFRARFGIANASFVRMDPTRPPFAPESFDAVLALGVLAFAEDAQGALRRLTETLRPGGSVVVGLYHRFARAVPPGAARYTQDEVLRWFDSLGIDFLSGLPPPDGSPFQEGMQLFEPHSRGGALRRALSQLTLAVERPRDDGLFVMVGRRRG